MIRIEYSIKTYIMINLFLGVTESNRTKILAKSIEYYRQFHHDELITDDLLRNTECYIRSTVNRSGSIDDLLASDFEGDKAKALNYIVEVFLVEEFQKMGIYGEVMSILEKVC